MAVPQKYRSIGDFHEYYSGARVAPYLTIFIGGNHEASNHMFELHYGGWAAPNIYYLGAANVIRCGPFRIAGMSGIYKNYDYPKPHFERLPYNHDAVRSIYHVREIDVRKLLQVRTQVDIGLSHDWPQGVEWTGDYQRLFTKKPGFIEDANSGRLGNVAAKQVLDRLRPAAWFSAHLHCKYAASIEHGEYIAPTATAQHRPMAPGQFLPQRAYKQGDSDISAKQDTNEAEKQAPPSEISPEQQAFNENQAFMGNLNDEAKISAWNNFHSVAAKREQEDHAKHMEKASEYHRQVEEGTIKPGSNVNYEVTWKKVVTDDSLGREVQEVVKTGFGDENKQNVEDDPTAQVKNADEIDIDLDSGSEASQKGNPEEQQKAPMETQTEPEPELKPESQANPAPEAEGGNSHAQTRDDADVPDELRDELPESFRKAKKAKITPVIDPMLPAGITNTKTDFLALDKCEGRRDFLQLLELHAVSESDGAEIERPYKLTYDKEWLAITRVLSEDFVVGDSSAFVPKNKGDGGYKSEILAAEEWIEEYVVKPGKMEVPENFTITAPVYDPSVPISTEEQPPEYLNPQTAEFCKLIGIENKFEMSDEQRQAQLDAISRFNAQSPESRPGRGGRGYFGRWGRGQGRGGRGRGGRGGRGRGQF